MQTANQDPPDVKVRPNSAGAASYSNEAVATALLEVHPGRVAELESEIASLHRRVETLERLGRKRVELIGTIRQELRRAARIQRNLQAPMPAFRDAEMRVLHRPADVVSGDAYEIVRLDSTRVGIALADACGHGVSAGVLSTYVKHLLRGIDPTAIGQLPQPNEVLRRINESLLATQLDDGEFVTALYAIYDEETRTLRWARGGAPYPVIVRTAGEAELFRTKGPLLGALKEADFEVGETVLQPGDTVFFHTDGLEALLIDYTNHDIQGQLEHTKWFRTLAHDDAPAQLRHLERAWMSAIHQRQALDDLTILALQV